MNMNEEIQTIINSSLEDCERNDDLQESNRPTTEGTLKHLIELTDKFKGDFVKEERRAKDEESFGIDFFTKSWQDLLKSHLEKIFEQVPPSLLADIVFFYLMALLLNFETTSWYEFCSSLFWNEAFMTQFYKRLENNSACLEYLIREHPRLLLNQWSCCVVRTLRIHLPFQRLHEVLMTTKDVNRQTAMFFNRIIDWELVRYYQENTNYLYKLLSIQDVNKQTAVHVNTFYATTLLKVSYVPSCQNEFAKLITIPDINNKTALDEQKGWIRDNLRWLNDQVEHNRYVLYGKCNVLIIYNTHNREGAEEEAYCVYDGLQSTKLCNVKIHKNKKENEMLQLIEESANQDCSGLRPSSLIVVLLSHGSLGVIGDVLGRFVSFTSIESAMSQKKLQNRPKILITQCCQRTFRHADMLIEHYRQSQTNYDARPARMFRQPFIPTHPDFCALMSTVPGGASRRGYFIPKLMTQIRFSKDNEPITLAFQRAYRQMAAEQSLQTPIIHSTLMADFCPINHSFRGEIFLQELREHQTSENSMTNTPPSASRDESSTSVEKINIAVFKKGISAVAQQPSTEHIKLLNQRLIQAIKRAKLSLKANLSEIAKISPTERHMCLQVSVEEGKSALYFAVEPGISLKLIRKLCQGLDSNTMLQLLTRDDLKSPFLRAVRKNNLPIVRYFLNKVPKTHRYRLVKHLDKYDKNAFHFITSTEYYQVATELFSVFPTHQWSNILSQKNKRRKVCPIELIVKEGNILLLNHLSNHIPAEMWNEMLDQPLIDDGYSITLLHAAVRTTTKGDKSLECLIKHLNPDHLMKLLQQLDSSDQNVVALMLLNLNLGAYKLFRAKLGVDQWNALINQKASGCENKEVSTKRELMTIADSLTSSQDLVDFVRSLNSLKELDFDRIFTVLGIQSTNGETVAHRAAEISCMEFFKFLSQLNPSEVIKESTSIESKQKLLRLKLLGLVNMTNHDEETVLHYACRKSDSKVIEKICSLIPNSELLTLLSHKSTSNDTRRNGTCLHTAVNNENVEAVRLILKLIEKFLKEDQRELFDAKDKDGSTIWQLVLCPIMRLTLGSKFDSYYSPPLFHAKEEKFARVVHNEFPRNKELFRGGAKVEADGVCSSLKSLGFYVKSSCELSEDGILEAIGNDIALLNKAGCSVYFVFILTHGDKGQIMGANEKLFNIDKVLLKMKDLNTLIPKVLIIQACQGGRFPTEVEAVKFDNADSRPPSTQAQLPQVNIKDINTSVVMATLNHHEARRGLFMKFLTKEFGSVDVEEQRFDDIFYRVCSKMGNITQRELDPDSPESTDKIAQIPQMLMTLAKKLMLRKTKIVNSSNER